LSSFDEELESWDTYVDRFEIFCTVNDVTEAKKTKVLLNMMGTRTYGLLQNLAAPKKTGELTYAELIKLLRQHLNPAPLIIAERFKFHRRDQERGETVVQYLAELRKLADRCKYGEMRTELIRDRFVCGLLNERIQNMLLTKTDLTLDMAISIALIHESAEQTTAEIQQRSHEREYETNQLTRKETRCYRCDKPGHSPEHCWFKKRPCRKCGRTGHMAKVCRGGAKQSKSSEAPKWRGNSKIHEIREDASTSEDEPKPTLTTSNPKVTLNSMKLNELNSQMDRETIWVKLDVENKLLNMELDTGSALTIVTESDYKRLWPHIPLTRADLTLRTYTGQKVYPKGRIKVTVKYRDKLYPKMYVYILPKGGAPLLGREWMRKLRLDWQSIQALTLGPTEESATNPSRLTAILTKAKDVFQSGLGTLRGMAATIEIDEQAMPKFFKARAVPYAIRPAVEAELATLERTGVLSRVDHSEWATPIVPVVKKSPHAVPGELQRD